MFESSNVVYLVSLMKLSTHLLANAPDSHARAFGPLLYNFPCWGLVPSLALGLHLQDHAILLCLLYWDYRCQREGYQCPICHAAANPFGDHQVGCGGNGDRIYRQDSLRDTLLFSPFYQCPCAKERGAISLLAVDLQISSFQVGKEAVLLHWIYVCNFHSSAVDHGRSNHMPFRRAQNETCDSSLLPANWLVYMSFIPLMVESLEGWSDEATDTITSIGHAPLGSALGNSSS